MTFLSGIDITIYKDRWIFKLFEPIRYQEHKLENSLAVSLCDASETFQTHMTNFCETGIRKLWRKC
jgi:hypothetical protein